MRFLDENIPDGNSLHCGVAVSDVEPYDGKSKTNDKNYWGGLSHLHKGNRNAFKSVDYPLTNKMKKRQLLKMDKKISVSNPYDLALSLRHMPLDIFKKHVTPTKNTFSSWLKKIGERELAEKISKYKTKDSLEKALLRELIEKIKSGEHHARN